MTTNRHLAKAHNGRSPSGDGFAQTVSAVSPAPLALLGGGLLALTITLLVRRQRP